MFSFLLSRWYDSHFKQSSLCHKRLPNNQKEIFFRSLHLCSLRKQAVFNSSKKKKSPLKSYLHMKQNENFCWKTSWCLKGCLSFYLSSGLFRIRKPGRRCWSQRQYITTEVTARVGGLFSTHTTSAGATYLPGEGMRPQQVGIWSRFTEVHEWVRWVSSERQTTVHPLDAMLKEINWWKERQHKGPLYLTSVWL